MKMLQNILQNMDMTIQQAAYRAGYTLEGNIKSLQWI